MKKIALGLLGVIVMGTIGNAVFSPTSARAQSVEQAGSQLAKTETQLAKAVTKSATEAAGVTKELQAPGQQGLPQQLQEFGKSNDRLKQLQEELTKDITTFEEARTAKLATLDAELQAIKDPTTRRQMERLRTRASTCCSRCTPNTWRCFDIASSTPSVCRNSTSPGSSRTAGLS